MGPQADRSTRREAPRTPSPAPRRTCRFARVCGRGSELGPWRKPGAPGAAAGQARAGPRSAPGRAGRWAAWPGRGPALAQGRSGRPGRAPRAGARCWEPGGPRAQPPRWGRRHRVPGMSFTRKKGFYKQDVNKTAWELPKTYVSLTHIGSGAYGSVW